MTIHRVKRALSARAGVLLAIIGVCSAGGQCFAETARQAAVSAGPGIQAQPATYADLVDLAENAPLIMRAKVRKQADVEPARVTGIRPGRVRLYLEAVTANLLTGPAAIGESLRYLADVPSDSRGKAPKLTKRDVLLFARPVSGRPGELQLVAPDAQIIWDAATEARLRSVLGELFAVAAPPAVRRVQEAIHVPGNLAGEGETQLFLETANGAPATITVLQHPGIPTHWSVSFSEVVASTALPPARDTLAWYRLACFLPRSLAAEVNVSATPQDRAQAEADYALVMRELGDCPRNRG